MYIGSSNSSSSPLSGPKTAGVWYEETSDPTEEANPLVETGEEKCVGTSVVSATSVPSLASNGMIISKFLNVRRYLQKRVSFAKDFHARSNLSL